MLGTATTSSCGRARADPLTSWTVADQDDTLQMPEREDGQSLADYLRVLGVPEADEQEYADRAGQTTSFWQVNGLPEPPDAA